MLIGGFSLSMRRLDNPKTERQGQSNLKSQLLALFQSFLPITAILIMVIILNIELSYALALSVLILFLKYNYNKEKIYGAIKYGFSKEVFVLILGIMFFKVILEDSGAVSSLSQYFNQQGLPLFPILIIIPFIIGLLTGITVAYVGSAFPLLISLAGGISLNQMLLAFIAGYAGVMLSPVYLCLILTREYFKADISRFYRKYLYQ